MFESSVVLLDFAVKAITNVTQVSTRDVSEPVDRLHRGRRAVGHAPAREEPRYVEGDVAGQARHVGNDRQYGKSRQQICNKKLLHNIINEITSRKYTQISSIHTYIAAKNTQHTAFYTNSLNPCKLFSQKSGRKICTIHKLALPLHSQSRNNDGKASEQSHRGLQEKMVR